MNKYAYVTFMNDNTIELTGALVMGYTLKKTKTTYDIIMLIGPSIEKNTIKLLSKFYSVIKYDHVIGLDDIFKLFYKKVIYLDIDIIILKNIDHVFKETTPSTVPGISGFLLLEPNPNISNIKEYLSSTNKLDMSYNYQFDLSYRKTKIYTIDDIHIINFPDDYEPWNQLIEDHFIDESEAKMIYLYKKYYDLWLNIFHRVKNKFDGLNLSIGF